MIPPLTKKHTYSHVTSNKGLVEMAHKSSSLPSRQLVPLKQPYLFWEPLLLFSMIDPDSSGKFLPRSRFGVRTASVFAAVLAISFLLLTSRGARSYIPASLTYSDKQPAQAEIIPNKVHFVYILADVTKDFDFQFSHFLSIYAAWLYWRPTTIYLHTNLEANSISVARAREGKAGKWSKLIFTLFNMEIRTVDVPTHAGNGFEIQGMEHKSDFIRVKAVHDLGGIYLDWDVHALRDIRPLRTSGFNAVAGRELHGLLNCGYFMSVRGGRLVRLWMEDMHLAYDGGWLTHSNRVLTKFGQRLVREPGEMLIMERDAFAPGSWENQDTDALFGRHDDEPSNLLNFTQGDTLPSYDESFFDRFNHPERFPAWARDWSSTYVLHAFKPDRSNHTVEGFEHISPRYVLERRSNFARAVYPVAKRMYEQGLVELSDSYLGH
ncbi:hypothetical protein VD0002_g5713 [Verticillium dahliae]|nr:hypothetical protein EV126DRAFT_416295 [Verticillium dahliae]PNH62313.1 hypothetical protein VD0002_g5713 [Verticillium dahliae]